MPAFRIIVTCTVGSGFEERHDSTDSMLAAVDRLLNGPFATVMKAIEQFVVIDSSDCLIFKAVNNEIVFPAKEDLASFFSGNPQSQ